MNTGALTGRPWRFASSACPASCTNNSTTNPSANFQPHSSEYAPIEITIESEVVTTLNLKIAKRMYLNFSRKAPTTISGAASLRSSRNRGSWRTGPGWYGS